MQQFQNSFFLRLVLLADAATCLACGLLLALGARLLEQFLALPADFSLYAGLSLFPFAAFLVYLAARQTLSNAVVWTVIVLNVLWTLDSFLILLGRFVEPNGLGAAFIVFQAIGVAVFAALEYFGLRKSTPLAA